MQEPSKQYEAFSLVELSIVLVILGLLVGGVLSGQSLIHAAELRSITTQHDAQLTAVQSFRDKYFAVPGDMANATQFWGIAGGMGNDVTCFNTASTGKATCNGDGDGFIGAGFARQGVATAQQQNEGYRAWQHLANAGLITGSFTGTYGSGDSTSNLPQAKTATGLWTVAYVGAVSHSSGEGSTFDGQYGTTFEMMSSANTGLFLPEDMWNIDTKMDDGKPGTGKLMIRDDDGIDNHSSDSCTSAVSTYQGATATYQLSSTEKKCLPIFSNQF